MKLTSKQLKALPDSEFGIVKNGKRSYPLVDQSHVRSAISFFSYAAPEDKSELAKKINAKAKKFGMKIHCSGEFMKYISPEVSKYDASATYITDASHIGVLSPIVGANSPSYDDTNYSDESKLIGAFAKGDLEFDSEFTEEGFIVRNLVNKIPEVTKKLLFGEPDMFKEPPENLFSDVFRLRVQDLILNREIEETCNYMTKMLDDSYISLRTYADVKTTEKIHAIIDRSIKDIGSYESLIADLTTVVMSDVTNKDRIVACLGIIYFKKPSILKDVIRCMFRHNSYYKCELDNFNDFRMDTLVKRKAEKFKFPNTKRLSPDEIAVFEYTFSNGNSFLNIIDAYIREQGEIYGYSLYDRIDISRLMIVDRAIELGKIDGYYSEYDTGFDKYRPIIIKKSFTKTYYIGNIYTDKDGLPYFLCIPILQFDALHDFPAYVSSITQYHRVYKKENVLKIKLSEGLTKANDMFISVAESTQDIFVNETSLIHTVISNAKNFMKGIHIDDDGLVKLNLTNKLSFEHYEEIHKTLKEADKNGNIEEVKSTLAYIFSIIATIERVYMNEGKGSKKRIIDKNDEKYKEMVRLRALYMSDFKVYLRKVAAKDSKFNFLEYYKTSNMNNSVYTLDAKKLALVFRTIMVS